eukprot:Em0024g492a
MSGTDEEGDTLELANSYKVNGKYPEGCDVNKKRSIRRKAEMIFLKNGEAWTKRKMNGTINMRKSNTEKGKRPVQEYYLLRLSLTFSTSSKNNNNNAGPKDVSWDNIEHKNCKAAVVTETEKQNFLEGVIALNLVVVTLDEI